MQRLSEKQMREVKQDFAHYMMDSRALDAEWADYVDGVQIIYMDDLDSGRSYFMVHDSAGRTDGAGWYTVEAE